MVSFALEHVTKVYPGVGREAGTVAVDDLTLRANDGEFVGLLGPSGCGKTTTLAVLAGLETPTKGTVVFGSQDVTSVPPAARNVGLVFQDYAVFTHMTIFENLAFGLKVRGVKGREVRDQVNEMATFLDLDHALDLKPSEISQSEVQRVALGRTLVTRPTILLLDEPLSNLEASVRNQVRLELRRLHRELGQTTVFVSHDQSEAVALADRIAVMDHGHLHQFDTPLNLYDSPADTFVAGFVGTPPMNLLTYQSAGTSVDGYAEFALPGEPQEGLRLPIARTHGLSLLTVGFRPEHVQLAAPQSDSLHVHGVVDELEPLGPETVIHVNVGQQSVRASLPGRRQMALGDSVNFWIELSKLRLFSCDDGKALVRPEVFAAV
jgi:multiple sugar transport system ATP-binding protein